jgi:hypothetical protein
MQGWQIAIIVIGIGISQISLSIFYFRPRELTGQYRGKRPVWKLLFIAAVLATLEGIVLLILPENLWWSN